MQKPLQVTYKGTERSPSFDALIRQRVDALERVHPRIIGCRVVVEIPYRSAGSGKVAVGISVEVDVPNRNTVVGKDCQERRESKEDQTAAINKAFEAVERQLVKIADEQARDVKRHDGAGQSGMVVQLFPEQNYGFVEVDNSSELYFTRNAVVGGSFDELKVGMVVQVTAATSEGPMGPQVSTLRLLGKIRTPS